MAFAGGSSSLTDDGKDLKCPICLEIFEKPIQISCGHSFCKDCIMGCLSKVSISQCPVCRTSFTTVQMKNNTRLANLIDYTSETCSKCKQTKCLLCCVSKNLGIDRTLEKCQEAFSFVSCFSRNTSLMFYKQLPCALYNCTQQVALSSFRKHKDTCTGTHDSKSRLVFKPVLPTSQPEPSVIPNRSTFKCPYCGTPNLVREDLIEHVIENHNQDVQQVVCPICASMPWGNPNQKSGNFLQHLNMRHKFDYDTFVDYDDEEDEILQAVLEKSRKEV